MEEKRKKSGDPKDAFDTMNPINHLSNIVLLSNLQRKNYKLVISSAWYKQILMSLIVFGIFLVILIQKIMKNSGSEARNNVFCFKFLDDVLIYSIVCESILYIVDMSFVYKGGHLTLYYFKIYEHIDILLGTTYNNVIKKRVLKVTIATSFFCGLYIILACSNLLFLRTYDNINFTLVLTFEYGLFFVNTLSILIICTHLFQIEYRLRRIKDILQDFYMNAKNITNDIGGENCVYFSEDVVPKTFKRPYILGQQIDLSSLNKCYLLITEQINFINSTFSVRILLNNTVRLWTLICFIYITSRLFTDKNDCFGVTPFAAGTRFLRLCISSGILFNMIYRCDKTYEQRDEIIRVIDHILVDKNIDASNWSILTEFRGLVRSRPVEFTAANFYRLDYGLLISFVSVIATFTIFVLQNFN